ncbi:SHOCT domain-containing protein [Acidaminobacter sp.]|uniref:SHOCT domain-containing protein n=1 Tax=Acidaminobacter sp. TaxID=1872102 RepID=UPI00137F0239|nr:hypothetical protein [Acidaminobacter sp.]MDK9711440.1 hypothetical protein [Acidaminobacter sp.]MZQ96995.1 hypothetical protein [Acidaminobacter sp.]
MMIIFWGIIGYVIYLALKGNDTSGRQTVFQTGLSGLGYNDSKYNAEATLKNRYAKGDIDEDTYLRMLRNLRG